MYSVLTQAYNIYKIDNESDALPYTPEGAQNAFNIFKPYLKIAKDCGTTNSTICWYQGSYKTIKDANWGNYSTNPNYYKVLLADGSAMVFRGGDGVDIDLEIFYDVNGEAPPNAWGKDLFEFNVKDKKLIPRGTLYIDGYEQACKAPNVIGWECTAWVIFNGNMDYLH